MLHYLTGLLDKLLSHVSRLPPPGTFLRLFRRNFDLTNWINVEHPIFWSRSSPNLFNDRQVFLVYRELCPARTDPPRLPAAHSAIAALLVAFIMACIQLHWIIDGACSLASSKQNKLCPIRALSLRAIRSTSASPSKQLLPEVADHIPLFFVLGQIFCRARARDTLNGALAVLCCRS